MEEYLILSSLILLACQHQWHLCHANHVTESWQKKPIKQHQNSGSRCNCVSVGAKCNFWYTRAALQWLRLTNKYNSVLLFYRDLKTRQNRCWVRSPLKSAAQHNPQQEAETHCQGIYILSLHTT